MKVIVIGLGSMGRRRIRLIKQIDEKIEIIGIDSLPERRKQAEEQFKIVTGSDLSIYLDSKSIDSAFVCTSPLSHADLINQCLLSGINVFSEINLVDDGYEENINLARKNNRILFLSSTPMYRKEIETIKKEVLEQKHRVSYQYHVGQYLPDWHPWETFKDFFVSDRRTNGCREILAIELPWITDVFGDIIDYKVQKTELTELDLNYFDTYQILLQHENGNMGILQIDVVSRKAQRYFTCIGENIHITWAGTPDSLNKYNINKKQDEKILPYIYVDKLDSYSSNIIEDAYKEEIKEFFQCISREKKSRWSFEKDKTIINIINKIEND